VDLIPICVQGSTIEVRNAHLNGAALNANWYDLLARWLSAEAHSASADSHLANKSMVAC